MKKAYLFALSAALAALFFLSQLPLAAKTTQAQAISKRDGYVPGELLVKFKGESELANLNSLNAEIGAKVTKEFRELGWQIVKLPDNVSTEQALAQYAKSRAIEFAQPNYIYHIEATPNDPSFGSLYGMQKIGAPTAWNTTTGNSNIVVAVIDTGIRRTHEDLAANIWQNPGEIAGNGIDDDANGYVDDKFGWDFIGNDPEPNEEYSHGSHVAGTIGAAGNNGKGVAGVNWNVSLLALKIHDATGNSTSARIVEAFNYVRMMKLQHGVNIRVTNNSYGGCNEACGYDQATKDAIDAAGRADILNVFAAGNSNANIETTPFYPASYNSPSILAIASSDQNDNRSGFSNYGAASVDLAAPGSGILSSVRDSDTAYVSLSGTSMASPHAAGAAALLFAANPNLSAASVKATLMNTVDVLPQWSGVVKTGGRLNIARAIEQQTVCAFSSPTPPNINFSAAAATGGIQINAPQNCDYTGFPSANWITANPGEGNGQVVFSVETNNTGNPRSATLEVAGLSFTITQSSLLPTAAQVEIGGRVLTESGRGASNVRLELRGGNMRESKLVRTNQLGYYRFTEIPAGLSYTITAQSKRYSFNPAIQMVNLLEDANVNFTATQR